MTEFSRSAHRPSPAAVDPRCRLSPILLTCVLAALGALLPDDPLVQVVVAGAQSLLAGDRSRNLPMPWHKRRDECSGRNAARDRSAI
jgi:hypothetical protein